MGKASLVGHEFLVVTHYLCVDPAGRVQNVPVIWSGVVNGLVLLFVSIIPVLLSFTILPSLVYDFFSCLVFLFLFYYCNFSLYFMHVFFYMLLNFSFVSFSFSHEEILSTVSRKGLFFPVSWFRFIFSFMFYLISGFWFISFLSLIIFC